MPRWKPIRKTIDPIEVRVFMLRNNIKNGDVAKALGVTTTAITLALQGQRVRMLHKVAKRIGYKPPQAKVR